MVATIIALLLSYGIITTDADYLDASDAEKQRMESIVIDDVHVE